MDYNTLLEAYLELQCLIRRFNMKIVGPSDLKEAISPIYEVISGKPSGEIYHREVYVCFSMMDAEACEARLLELIEAGKMGVHYQSGDWLWGPHIHRVSDPRNVKVWDGFNEVPAPAFVSTGEVPVEWQEHFEEWGVTTEL